MTYAGVAVNPLALRIRTERFKTLVILDEVHHAGDALSWGEGVREAFEPAHRRLALTGTPFRSDVNPIPFVTYAPGGDGVPRSVADYTYGYADALADHVVRPVLFMAYSGEMQWRTRAGDEIAARLGEPLTKDLTAQALRTALDPEGAWIPSVLAAADTRLSEVRRHVPDAGGLVIATDQDSARAYARLLKAVSGETPTVVLSDEKAGVEEDRDVRRRRRPAGWSRSGWSPRASTCRGWPSASTRPRPRRRCSSPRRSAGSSAPGGAARPRRSSCRRCRTCWPTPPSWRSQRDHVLGRRITDEDDIFAAEDDLLAQAQQAGSRRPRTSSRCRSRRWAREARFDRVLFDGGEFGHEGEVHVGSEEEMDFLGIPGLLEPDQVRDLLRHQRQSEPARSRSRLRAGARRRRELTDPRAARRAAPRAQRPGRRLAPPHRPAARGHPRRAAQGVRRPRRRRRHRRPAPGQDRPGAEWAATRSR